MHNAHQVLFSGVQQHTPRQSPSVLVNDGFYGTVSLLHNKRLLQKFSHKNCKKLDNASQNFNFF